PSFPRRPAYPSRSFRRRPPRLRNHAGGPSPIRRKIQTRLRHALRQPRTTPRTRHRSRNCSALLHHGFPPPLLTPDPIRPPLRRSSRRNLFLDRRIRQLHSLGRNLARRSFRVLSDVRTQGRKTPC